VCQTDGKKEINSFKNIDKKMEKECQTPKCKRDEHKEK
jgi:hypothetical protein